MIRSKAVLFLVVSAAWLFSFLISFYLIIIGFMMVVTGPIVFHLGVDAYLDDCKEFIASLFELNTEIIHFWRFSLVLALVQSLCLLAWKRFSSMAPAVLFSAILAGAFLTIVNLITAPEFHGAASIVFGFIFLACAAALATWSLFQFKVIRYRWQQRSKA